MKRKEDRLSYKSYKKIYIASFDIIKKIVYSPEIFSFTVLSHLIINHLSCFNSFRTDILVSVPASKIFWLYVFCPPPLFSVCMIKSLSYLTNDKSQIQMVIILINPFLLFAKTLKYLLVLVQSNLYT